MELGELEELQKRERDCVEMVKEQTAKVYQAHRLHHLLSTEQVGLQENTHNLTDQYIYKYIFDQRPILNCDSFLTAAT